MVMLHWNQNHIQVKTHEFSSNLHLRHGLEEQRHCYKKIQLFIPSGQFHHLDFLAIKNEGSKECINASIQLGKNFSRAFEIFFRIRKSFSVLQRELLGRRVSFLHSASNVLLWMPKVSVQIEKFSHITDFFGISRYVSTGSCIF